MVTRELPDAELVGRAQHGERDAYEELVRRYQDLVIRVAYLVTGNAAEAEDAAQDAFIKVYASLGRVQPDSFRPWLLRVAINEARNLRKAARRRAGIGQSIEDLSLTSPSPTPEMAALANEQRMVLLQALDGLRDDDRLAIGYRYFFDLSETEMVEALGWPRGTVKSRLSRALGRFRQELTQVALVPVVGVGLPDVARELAGWDEARLQAGLSGLSAHFWQLPVHDLTARLLDHLPPLAAGAAGAGAGAAGGAAGDGSGSGGTHPTTSHVSLQAVVGGLGLAVIVGLAALASRPAATPTPQPGPTPASVVVAGAATSPTAVPRLPTATPPAPTPPAVDSTTIAVFAADLTDAERSEVASLLGVDSTTSTETIGRDEALSTLAAAGLPVAPSDQTLSSVRLTCPSPAARLTVRTEHITHLSPLTYATALLVAGSTDVSAIIAAPVARPVTGETAMVGMLRADGRCTGKEAQTSARVSQAYLVVQLTSQVADASGNWPAAAAIVARGVQAVVTGQATAQAGIASALDQAAADAGVALDPPLTGSLAAALVPLLGQDYGPFGHGYRIDQPSPTTAQLIP